MAKYTPEQFGDLMDRFAKGLPEAVAAASFAATQQLLGDIKGRIHNTSGTEDIKGNTRKYRSESWKEVRQNPREFGYSNVGARQTNVVDHTFTGNLQKRGYKIVEQKRAVIIKVKSGFKNSTKIELEKFYPAPVWEASESEEDRAIKVFADQMRIFYNKFFETRG